MSATTYYTTIDSPFGAMTILGDERFVTGLYLPQHKGWRGLDASYVQADEPFVKARQQLGEYFMGDRQEFDIQLKPAGTRFQQRAWQELTRIPFGVTIAYAELARRVGNPAASRAVGHANGCNPISILVPCHRVIGASGKLTGYAGGIEKKRWLLDWEQRVLAGEESHSRGLGAAPNAAMRVSAAAE